jgi:hypothetical protein
MGETYSPALYWTSCLRSKAGIYPYENTDRNQSTFTINDKSGTFTELLLRNGYNAARSWRSYPTYHIEVNTSETGLLSKFYLDPHQINKVCLIFHCIILLYRLSFLFFGVLRSVLIINPGLEVSYGHEIK